MNTVYPAMLAAVAFAAPIVGFASIATWQALAILHEYRRHAEVVPDNLQDTMRRREGRWRTCAHFLWFLSPFPLPAMLISDIAEATQLLQRSTGTAVMVGAILLVLRLAFRIEFTKLFSKELALVNEISLAAWGALVSLALTTLWIVTSDTGVRAELLKRLFSN